MANSNTASVATPQKDSKHQKLLDDIQKKRQQKAAEEDLKLKKMEGQKNKLREQVAKKNAGMIKQRMETKQKEAEEKQKQEEEKKVV